MSNSNSPAQRPVQHNPYTMTPLQQAADRNASNSPPPPLETQPAQGTPKTSPGQPEGRQSGGQGSGPALGFMNNFASMYVATPQQGPHPARMSPPPNLATKSPHHQPQSSPNQRPYGNAPQSFTPYGNPHGGRGGGGQGQGQGSDGGFGNHGSVFGGTFGVTSGERSERQQQGGWGNFHGSDVPSYTFSGGGGGGGGSGGGFGSFEAGGYGAERERQHGGGGNFRPEGFQSTFGAPRQFHSYPTPSHSQNQMQPQMQPRTRRENVPRNMSSSGRIAHAFLQGKLRYTPLNPEFFVALPPQRMQTQSMMGDVDRPIQMFSGRGREMQSVCPTADLFVAQLPFNMELSALQYIFDTVAPIGCDIMHAAPHYKRGRSYDGCAFVKVSQAVAAILVETFHKAALFDQEGVWIADTPEQREDLAQYCAFMQQKTPQERRAILQKPIPFSAMTVEFANRSYSF